MLTFSKYSRPQGYATMVSPEGTVECDTFTCGHCQFVMHVKPKADPADMGGLCKQCMKLICPKCVNKLVCSPWEKTMVEMEAKDRALRSYGI